MRFRPSAHPRGVTPWALQDVTCLLIYLKTPVLRDHLDPKNRLRLSYIDHIDRKRHLAQKGPRNVSVVRRPPGREIVRSILCRLGVAHFGASMLPFAS